VPGSLGRKLTDEVDKYNEFDTTNEYINTQIGRANK